MWIELTGFVFEGMKGVELLVFKGMKGVEFTWSLDHKPHTGLSVWETKKQKGKKEGQYQCNARYKQTLNMFKSF